MKTFASGAHWPQARTRPFGAVVALSMVLILCGCAHSYVMKLTNGVQITTPRKPRLEGSSYHYKDAMGRDNVISQSRVLEIEPASMAADQSKFTPPSPRKKHWWHFW